MIEPIISPGNPFKYDPEAPGFCLHTLTFDYLITQWNPHTFSVLLINSMLVIAATLRLWESSTAP